MNYLYLLTEDDHDDLFYEQCAERISGKSFYRVNPRRVRKNGGVSAVRGVLPAFINDLKGAPDPAKTFFIIAIDNDRAPAHPDHERLTGLSTLESGRGCRYCELEKALTDSLGHDRSQWPAQGAIAVPVEMLESWLLLGLEPDRAPLPIFSKKAQARARAFYGSNVPDQLKDLCRSHLQASGIPSMGELILDVGGKMDLAALSANSPSFLQFHEEVAAWSE